MAMINCKECNNPVSSTAPTCPNCGAPVKRADVISSMARAFLLMFIAVPVGLAIFSGFLHPTTPQQPAVKNSATTKPSPKTTTTQAPPSAEELWLIRSSTSPINDANNIHLRRQSTTTITNAYGQKYRPTLHLRCAENTTNAYIAWNEFLSTESIPVLTRIDKQPATTNNWTISTDYKSIGKWTGSSDTLRQTTYQRQRAIRAGHPTWRVTQIRNI